MDTHATPQQSGVAGLQNRIDRVLDDYWIGSFRLRFVPSVFGRIERRQGFGFVDERLGLGVTLLGGEQGHHWRAAARRDVWLQRFPGLMAYRAWNRSWMMLLAFSFGANAISSEAAASTIQKAGCCKNSTVIGVGVALP